MLVWKWGFLECCWVKFGLFFGEFSFVFGIMEVGFLDLDEFVVFLEVIGLVY